MALPEPPTSGTDPLTVAWAAGTTLWRCHDAKLAPTEFNPGFGSGRFHPIDDSAGASIPTLYGSDTVAGALSEAVFRNVPSRGRGKQIFRSSLDAFSLSVVSTTEDIMLAELTDIGLRRLGVTRQELIESGGTQYTVTARWAAAIHRDQAGLQGLTWVSRQDDSSKAAVLYGDRVPSASLAIVSAPIPLSSGGGLALVLETAEAARVAVVV